MPMLAAPDCPLRKLAPAALAAVAVAGVCYALRKGYRRCSKSKNNTSDKKAETATTTVAATTSTSSTRLDAVVFSGPSGVGKGTIIAKLRDKFSNNFGFSVSHTTRAARNAEVDGKDYHFVEKAKVEAMIASGEFLESCNVHGNIYGTSKAALNAVRDSGKVAIIEMDVQGAQKLRKQQAGLRFLYIFVHADEDALLSRLKSRGTDSEEKIRVRLDTAKQEARFIKENPTFYDRIITNDDLDRSFAEIVAVLREQGAFTK